MRLTYIFHSGFALECEKCILIFDYWMDPAGILPSILQTDKPVYVFASHFHEDHFNKDIFQWQKDYPSARFTYVLSKDILKRHRCQHVDADVWLVKGNRWQDEQIEVYAMGSNDSGVSWIVKVDGKCIFHAGDLNNWYARFLTDSFDLAMFPVDGRIGNGYTRGARQFIERFKVGLFVPMHFVASGFKSAWRMKEFTDAQSIPFWKIGREGEQVVV